MLCVSAIVAVVRCLSVRLSVTLVDCIHTAEVIIKLLDRPGSPISLGLTLCADTHFKGNPFSGAQNTRGRKNSRFSTEIAVCIRDGTLAIER